jgi:hypothetical protein
MGRNSEVITAEQRRDLKTMNAAQPIKRRASSWL